MITVLSAFLPGIIPILFLWNKNIVEINYKKIIKIVSLYFLIFFLLFLTLNKIFFDKQHISAFLCSLILFCFYGKIIIEKIQSKPFSKKEWKNILYLLLLIIYPFLPKTIITYISYAVFSISSFFIIVLCSEIIKHYMAAHKELSSNYHPEYNKDIQLKKNINLPNIYFIVPDSYSGETSLSRYYHFNNSEFLSWLKDEGFTINPQAKPNYSHTNYSLPSTFHMNYLINFIKYDSTKSVNLNLAKLANIHYNSNTIKFLKKIGYKTIHILNDYDKYYIQDKYYGFNQKIDMVKSYHFEYTLFSTTYLYKPIRTLLNHLSRQSMLKVFDFMETHNFVHDCPNQPFFVYAHFICPHHPFYFDKDGNMPKLQYDFRDKKKDPFIYPKLYLDQIIYLNKRLKKIIRNIKHNDPNSIIILQADHGGAVNMIVPGLAKSNADIWHERYNILRAIYGPKSYNLDFESSVNLFPTIFNNWLEKPLKIKEDLYWFLLDDANFKMIQLKKNN